MLGKFFGRLSRFRPARERDGAPHAGEHAREVAAAELELAEATFDAAFDEAPGAVAMVAGGGEADGRFLRVNPAFARMLGRSVAELHLCEIASVTHPDDRHLDAAPDSADGADGGVRSVRKRYLHSSGRPVQAEVRVSEVRDGGGVLSLYVHHIIDLDALAASERAVAHAARIRREMVTTISHELRTPLTSVQGYLEMIAGEDFGALGDEQKRMIDIAVRNTQRLEEFVADLLMLARLDAAELEPIGSAPVDIGAVVDAAVGDRAADSAARRQQLTVDRPQRGPVVHGDAAHLKRAVQSLISNAVKYTPEGGRVRVCVQPKPAAVRIVVEDTGLGIRPDEIGLLGNRFYRGADAHRRAIGGTGLGLAIAKTIVERHHGAIDIASVPGKGSRFTIELPLQPP
jgi:PAS domain S-box-containing protein